MTCTLEPGTDAWAAKFGLAPTGVGDGPRKQELSVVAYPNPFNPTTTIRYVVPATGRVVITIHDARGAYVAMLLDEKKTTGEHTISWDGHNSRGDIVSSGVYFAKALFAGEQQSSKLVLVK
jgi:FlgD Ig-like domain